MSQPFFVSLPYPQQNIVTLHPKNAAGRQTLCVNEPLFLFRKVVTAEKGENLIRFWQLGNEDYGKLKKLKKHAGELSI